MKSEPFFILLWPDDVGECMFQEHERQGEGASASAVKKSRKIYVVFMFPYISYSSWDESLRMKERIVSEIGRERYSSACVG